MECPPQETLPNRKGKATGTKAQHGGIPKIEVRCEDHWSCASRSLLVCVWSEVADVEVAHKYSTFIMSTRAIWTWKQGFVDPCYSSCYTSSCKPPFLLWFFYNARSSRLQKDLQRALPGPAFSFSTLCRTISRMAARSSKTPVRWQLAALRVLNAVLCKLKRLRIDWNWIQVPNLASIHSLFQLTKLSKVRNSRFSTFWMQKNVGYTGWTTKWSAYCVAFYWNFCSAHIRF